MADSTHSAIAYSELTGYLPLVSNLEWGLGSEVSFSAGEVLAANLVLKNDQAVAKHLYVTGALLDEVGAIVAGTEFSAYLADGASYAVNSALYLTAFEVNGEDSRTVQCQFTLGRSDLHLHLVMLEMSGDEPAVDDTIRGTVSTLLSTPAATGIDIGSLMGMMVVVMMIGVMIPMMSGD